MRETGFIKPSSGHSFSPPAKASLTVPFILGVAGGSGSGKTYFSRALVDKLNDRFQEEICQMVCQDNFYIDQSKRFDHDGGSVNFDHPESIDFSLLAACLRKLKTGEKADIPLYDFATHTRKKETLTAHPKKIVVVDGILIFHALEVCQLFDERIFFETPEELRFQRRLERDVKERGRKPEGVHQQFFKQVKPMHDMFVEPSKKFAETIVKDIGHFEHVLNSYFEKLQSL